MGIPEDEVHILAGEDTKETQQEFAKIAARIMASSFEGKRSYLYVMT